MHHFKEIIDTFVSAKYPLEYFAVFPNDDDLKESLDPNRNGDL